MCKVTRQAFVHFHRLCYSMLLDRCSQSCVIKLYLYLSICLPAFVSLCHCVCVNDSIGSTLESTLEVPIDHKQSLNLLEH